MSTSPIKRLLVLVGLVIAAWTAVIAIGYVILRGIISLLELYEP